MLSTFHESVCFIDPLAQTSQTWPSMSQEVHKRHRMPSVILFGTIECPSRACHGLTPPPCLSPSREMESPPVLSSRVILERLGLLGANNRRETPHHKAWCEVGPVSTIWYSTNLHKVLEFPPPPPIIGVYFMNWRHCFSCGLNFKGHHSSFRINIHRFLRVIAFISLMHCQQLILSQFCTCGVKVVSKVLVPNKGY